MFSVFKKSAKPRPERAPVAPKQRDRFRPRVEEMEPRLVPAAVLTVMNNLDGTNPVPANSLRDCISRANNGDTIQFGINQQMIQLVAGISSNKNLTIDGGENAGNIIDGTNGGTPVQAFNFFAGQASVIETIRNLQFQNCYSGFANNGGAIYVRGALTLTKDSFVGNEANGSGGAVAVQARLAGDTLTVTGCHFNRNFTTPSRGGNGGAVSVTLSAPPVGT